MAEKGVVVHANHYLEPAMAEFNVRIGKSSETRLARISDLMKASPRPCRLDAMAKISKDQHDGPDNSLWRTGNKERTLASWIVENRAQGDPKLRVVIANPGQMEETQVLTLNERFWRDTK